MSSPESKLLFAVSDAEFLGEQDCTVAENLEAEISYA